MSMAKASDGQNCDESSARTDVHGLGQRRARMKILFLHEVNYLRKPIFEMHELPEYLAKRGHHVGFVQFPESEDKEALKTLPWKQDIQGRAVKDSRLTLYTPKTGSGGLLGRLMAAAAFGREFKRILVDFNPDVVVSFSVPTSGWQALRVSRRANSPYLFRALDVSHKIRRSAFSGLILQAEKYIFRHAGWVSANNPAMLDYCISLGAEPTRSSVELPPLNVSHFSPQPGWRVQVRGKLGIPSDAKVILYMGSFFYFSGLPDLIRSFADARLENQFLVLVGGGEQEAELRVLVRSLELENAVLFTGFVSFDELPKYLAIADVAVNPMIPSLVSNTAFPNKIIQYLSASLPVVSTRLKGVQETFTPSAALSLVSSPAQVFSAANEVLRLNDRSEIAEKARMLVSSKFVASSAVDQFERLLISVSEV
jgi:glycosyltransferase involved in cell wall biosynthesis